jgi:hypothetical protein
MVEINFLCVHKALRSKRLAPVLIKEVTRRVNMQSAAPPLPCPCPCPALRPALRPVLRCALPCALPCAALLTCVWCMWCVCVGSPDIWQAVYTAGVVLPKPVAQNRYYHRSLNPKKLIEIGFSRLQPRMTLARTIKLYKLPAVRAAPPPPPPPPPAPPAPLCALPCTALHCTALLCSFRPARYAPSPYVLRPTPSALRRTDRWCWWWWWWWVGGVGLGSANEGHPCVGGA